MLPSHLAKQTVVRLRGEVTTDDWDNDSIDWSGPDRLTIEGCVFQPLAGDEFNESRDAITTRWDWFGPPDADVLSTDRLEYRNIAYEIDGSVQEPQGLGLDHKRAVCKRVEG